MLVLGLQAVFTAGSKPTIPGPMVVSGLTVVGLTFNWALLLVPSLVLE